MRYRQVLPTSLVRRKIKCPETLWLLDDIIYSYPGGKNAPIGNYTSQWFGNLYLNELDQLVKHTLGFKELPAQNIEPKDGENIGRT